MFKIVKGDYYMVDNMNPILAVCSICESSCETTHKYEIDGKDYYVCDLHYKLIKAISSGRTTKTTKQS